MAEAVTTDWVGVKFIDDVCALDPILKRANALASTSGSPLRATPRLLKGTGVVAAYGLAEFLRRSHVSGPAGSTPFRP
jgi:hypothetical protein